MNLFIRSDDINQVIVADDKTGDPPFFRTILVTIILGLLFAFLILSVNNFVRKSVCLASKNPRRWYTTICEEWINEEWIEVNPWERDPRIYYNEGAKQR
jgi:hypothetical protein